MKRYSIYSCCMALAIAFVLMTNSASATILYQETFDAVPTNTPPDTVDCTGSDPPADFFPIGMLRRNVDNRTPHPDVNYVDNAWMVRGDYLFNVSDCAAFSTSWYTPAAVSNDWMWTPLITLPSGNLLLSWNAIAYDPNFRDGYEVRVITQAAGPPTGGTGVIGNQITSSTQVFSVAQESSAWTANAVNLSAFAGQGVYIGFHNNSSDKFLLLIDDIKVQTQTLDVAATNPLNPSVFTRIPRGMAIDPSIGLTASNVGEFSASNVSGSAQWFRDDIPILSAVASDVIAAIAPSANAPMVFAINLPIIATPELGTWAVRYSIVSSPADETSGNNAIYSSPVQVTLGDLARHAGSPAATLGIGAANGGELGVQFTITQALIARAIRFTLGAKDEMLEPSWGGLPVVARLRNFTAGAPDALSGTGIATTISAPAQFAPAEYELPFSSPVILEAGTYVMTVVEPTSAGGGALPLHMHNSIYQIGHTWVNWPTNPNGPNWSHFETFGPMFAKTPAITLITDFRQFADGFEDLKTLHPEKNGVIIKPMAPASPPTRAGSNHELHRISEHPNGNL